MSLITSNFTLPVEVADGIFQKVQTTSVVAKLAGPAQMKYGQSNVMTLTGHAKAEVVGEGVEKSETPITFGNAVVTPVKLQTTIRLSNEVLWADEDQQLDILKSAMSEASDALGRGVDLVAFHKLNPLAGKAATSLTTGIADTTNSVTDNGKNYDQIVELAAQSVIKSGYMPNGIALDPAFSFDLAVQRDADGRKIYPELGLGQNITSFEGINAAVGTTVSASAEAATATGVEAFVGDWSALRWGVQRNIAAHLIEFGDPDGDGDLQRLNQVAVRAELVVGIGILDLDAFAKIVKTA